MARWGVDNTVEILCITSALHVDYKRYNVVIMATNQVTRKKDMNRNPEGKGGFGDNPQNRNPGGWDKTESISYQYNLIGRMSDEELATFVPKNQFQKIALARVKSARDEKLGLNDTKEITDRTEGKAPQSIDLTSNGETIGATITFQDHPEADDSNTDVS